MIGLIVARSKNNCIGKNGKIPWKIKGEQKQFKELTTGNVVVMGRNSYDEIGHPLPNRETIVISKSKKYVGRNIHTASSVKEAIELAKGNALGLTKLEYEIIELLSMNPEMVFDKERIYEKISGYDAEGDSRVVTELIRRIRKKINQYTEHEYIETIWGMGYKWTK